MPMALQWYLLYAISDKSKIAIKPKVSTPPLIKFDSFEGFKVHKV